VASVGLVDLQSCIMQLSCVETHIDSRVIRRGSERRDRERKSHSDYELASYSMPMLTKSRDLTETQEKRSPSTPAFSKVRAASNSY
jgi:hypothetical protein